MKITDKTRQYVERLLTAEYKAVAKLLIECTLAGYGDGASVNITTLFQLQFYCVDMGIKLKELDEVLEQYIEHVDSGKPCLAGERCAIKTGLARWRFLNWAGPGPEGNIEECGPDKRKNQAEQMAAALMESLLGPRPELQQNVEKQNVEKREEDFKKIRKMIDGLRKPKQN